MGREKEEEWEGEEVQEGGEGCDLEFELKLLYKHTKQFTRSRTNAK